jgi:hypothetical protein
MIHVDITHMIRLNATINSLGEFQIIYFLDLFFLTPPLEIPYSSSELPSLKTL